MEIDVESNFYFLREAASPKMAAKNAIDGRVGIHKFRDGIKNSKYNRRSFDLLFLPQVTQLCD